MRKTNKKVKKKVWAVVIRSLMIDYHPGLLFKFPTQAKQQEFIKMIDKKYNDDLEIIWTI